MFRIKNLYLNHAKNAFGCCLVQIIKCFIDFCSGLDVQSLNKLLKYIADLLKADEYVSQPVHFQESVYLLLEQIRICF